MVRGLSILIIAALVATGCGVPEPPPSSQALAAKAKTGDVEAITLLVQRLGRETPREERAEIYRALLESGKAAGPALVAACEDPDPVVREHALALAAGVGADGAFDAGARALADETFTRSHAAAWALGELGDERGVPLLITALERGKPELTAKAAARSLAKFGSKAVPALVEALPRLENEQKGYALRNLGEMRVPSAIPALKAALADPASRSDAAWALGTMGRKGEVVDLTPHLNDPDWRVRVEAARSVGLLGDKAAVPILDELRKTDPVTEVRTWAARGMSLITGKPEDYLTPTGEWKTPSGLYH